MPANRKRKQHLKKSRAFRNADYFGKSQGIRSLFPWSIFPHDDVTGERKRKLPENFADSEFSHLPDRKKKVKRVLTCGDISAKASPRKRACHECAEMMKKTRAVVEFYRSFSKKYEWSSI